jgi:hypothetical protein
MGEKIIVTVQGMVRGTNDQEAFGFVAERCDVTETWGLQPGFAVVTWAKADLDNRVILPLAAITIELGGKTFYGICQNAVTVNSHDGRSLTQQFSDMRALLQYDWIYGQFNIRRESRLVNGRWVPRYKHLLPADFNAHRYTYTDTPYTGREILNFCFAAATVESPWLRSYVPALNVPVLNVDAYGGKQLGTLVAEVSERCATSFTMGATRYSLRWAVRGLGAIPEFPANATERRLGLSVTENPSRVRVLGERNLYQVLNIAMERDWLPAWEAFVDVDLLADDLFRHESTEAVISGIAAGTRYNAIPGDTGQLIGRNLAAARARTILVEEYARLREIRDSGMGAAFRDERRAFGQSRLQLPAITYIQALLFRAFRPPANFSFTNFQGVTMTLAGLDMTGQALTEISHNPVTGVMAANLAEQRMVGNGYAIVKGYAVGADHFRTLQPGYFRVEDWVSAQEVWQAVPFQMDDSGADGKFIVFQEPVINSSDLITEVAIDDVTQAYPALKRAATITVPQVRAALTFAGERMSVVRGTGTRDGCENVPGLAGWFLVTGGGLTELPLADGSTASQQAHAIALNLLNRQFLVVSGGYKVQGSNATGLTSMIGRATVGLSAEAGLEERIDFANDRVRGVDGRGRVQVEPPRDFERAVQLAPLLPGERENREAANQLRVQASALRQNPQFVRFLLEAFHRLMGLDAPPGVFYLQPPPPASTPLPAGTPLVAEADEAQPTQPKVVASATRLTKPVFKGATIYDGEAADGPVRATASGTGNVVFLRVKGPTAINEAVGIPEDPDDGELAVAVDYFEAEPHTVFGSVLAEVADGVIAYVPVRIGSGGAALRHPFRIVKGATWLTFVVKTGYVITLSTGTEVVPTGVDTEIEVDPGVERYWFYVNLAADPPALEHSATLPDWLESTVPIGHVNTTDTENEVAEIGLQFIHDNIYSPCV